MQAKLSREREELLSKIKEMAEEKEQLDSASKRQHEQELAREKAAAEKLAQERDELMQAVQRMKDELMKEREEKKLATQQAVLTAEKTKAELDAKAKAKISSSEGLSFERVASGGFPESPTCSSRKKKVVADNPFDIDMDDKPLVSPKTSLYELLEEERESDPSGILPRKTSPLSSPLSSSSPSSPNTKAEKIDALKAKAKLENSKLDKKSMISHSITTISEEETLVKTEKEKIQEELVVSVYISIYVYLPICLPVLVFDVFP